MSLFNYDDLKFFAENGFNVLFEGESGVGKTAVVRQLFNEVFGKEGVDWLYFSCSTLDPFVDIRGIPREKYRSDTQKAEDVKNGIPGEMEYLVPKWHKTVKAIFFDELGRDDKMTRNALMELTNAKAINGEKLPNLITVWGAMNPVDDNGTYQVEMLDPAQLSRFPVRIPVPYDVEDSYFASRYGEDLAKGVIAWWRELDMPLRKKLNPRQLDNAMQVFALGGNIRYCIPQECGIDKLMLYLNEGATYAKFLTIFNKEYKTQEAKDKAIKKFFNVENNYAGTIRYVLKDKEMIRQCLKNLKYEKIADLVSTNEDCMEAFASSPNAVFSEIFTEINNSKINPAFTDKIFNAYNEGKYPDLVKNFKEMGVVVIHGELLPKPTNPVSLPKTFKFEPKHTVRSLKATLDKRLKEFNEAVNDDAKSDKELKDTYEFVLSHIPPKAKWNEEVVKDSLYGLSFISGALPAFDDKHEKLMPHFTGVINELFGWLKENNLWDKALANKDEYGMAIWSTAIMNYKFYNQLNIA